MTELLDRSSINFLPVVGKSESCFDLNHDWITYSDLIWKIMIWFTKRVIWFDLIWNFMIWFEIIPNHKNFWWYNAIVSDRPHSVMIQLLCWQATMKQVAKFTSLVWQIEYLWSSRGLGPNQWQLLFCWHVSTAAAATVRVLNTCRLKRIRDLYLYLRGGWPHKRPPSAEATSWAQCARE